MHGPVHDPHQSPFVSMASLLERERETFCPVLRCTTLHDFIEGREERQLLVRSDEWPINALELHSAVQHRQARPLNFVHDERVGKSDDSLESNMAPGSDKLVGTHGQLCKGKPTGPIRSQQTDSARASLRKSICQLARLHSKHASLSV